MSHLKQTEELENKIGKSIKSSPGCCSEQYPWISLRYMTSNKKYSIEFFSHQNEKNKTLEKLYKKFEELSSVSWRLWMEEPKARGMETIYYHQLNFSPNSDLEITKDEKIYVFRFDTYQGTGKGRIIGYKKSPCAVFHVIGYDFDFSAYKH